jgi:glyoxylase I family protein
MPTDRRQTLLFLATAYGSALAGIASASSQPNRASASDRSGEKGVGKPAQTSASSNAQETQMEKVLGIGGLFFRSKDPAALGKWYLDHLGIALIPTSYDAQPWHTDAGTTAFAPFPENTDYFDRQWMVNFRVRDLDKMAAQLQGKGIEVKIDPTAYPNGRFARIHDPEGNPIELWQPKGPA